MEKMGMMIIQNQQYIKLKKKIDDLKELIKIIRDFNI